MYTIKWKKLKTMNTIALDYHIKKRIIMKNIMLIILFLSIHQRAFAIHSNAPHSYKNLSDTIIALDSTRVNYQKDVLLQTQSLKQEYKIFINYLSLQISDYCTQIIDLYGEQSLINLPCSKNDAAILVDNYQTSEEKVESLEDEFMTAMGDFDEMLLVEDEKIAQIHQKKEADSGQSGSGRQGNNSSEHQSSTNNEFSNEDQLNNQQEYPKESRSKGGNNKQSNKKNKQRRGLDKMDDDIVARQLKEAAEKERDPQLKEKLWNEYYKYKQNMGSS